MAVYTEPITQRRIVELTSSFKTILVVGCNFCTNESLAYYRGTYISKIIKNDQNEYSRYPFAIHQEIDRIKSILETNGHTVCVWGPRDDISHLDECTFICEMDDEECNSLLMYYVKTEAEAVLAYCCLAGIEGIKKALCYSAKIIPAVETWGLIQLHPILSGTFIGIDQSKTRVIHMKVGGR